MKGFFKKLDHYLLGHPDYVNLDQRFLHIICLGGSIVALISIPVNHFIVTNFFLTVTNIVEAAILLTAYLASRITGRNRYIEWATLLSILAFLSIQWFYNAGSSGGTQYYFILIALIGAFIFDRWTRIFFINTTALIILTLITIEYTRPELITGYNSAESRMIDVGISFTLTIILSGIVISILSSHNNELFSRIQRKNREHEEDLIIAKRVQEELFTYDKTKVKQKDFAMLYSPSHTIGGDFCDIVNLRDKLRILLADMKGHGINAALTAMLIKSEWINSGHELLDPGKALTDFNRQIIQRYGNSILLSASLIDIYTDRIDYSMAGSPNQYVKNRTGIVRIESCGPQLGIIDNIEYTCSTLSADNECQVLLFSDALVEEYSQKGTVLKQNWLEELLEKKHGSADELLNTIITRFKILTGKNPGQTYDDLTVIAAGFSGTPVGEK